jgi:hypothetical protein
MTEEQFKSMLRKAMLVINDSEERKDPELQRAFYSFYEKTAPMVFPKSYEVSRLLSPGFKLHVQQVLDLIHDLDETTETRNQEQQKFSDNVFVLNNFRKQKDEISRQWSFP